MYTLKSQPRCSYVIRHDDIIVCGYPCSKFAACLLHMNVFNVSADSLFMTYATVVHEISMPLGVPSRLLLYDVSAL